MVTELSEAGQEDRVLGWSWADPHPIPSPLPPPSRRPSHPHLRRLPSSSPHCRRCRIELCFYNFSSPSADSMCRVIFKKQSRRELPRLTAAPLVKWGKTRHLFLTGGQRVALGLRGDRAWGTSFTVRLLAAPKDCPLSQQSWGGGGGRREWLEPLTT